MPADFPLAHSGMPNQNYAGGSSYVPIIFATELLVEFYANTVLTEITSREYEGEIKQQGSEVVIRELPNIEFFSFAKGQKIQYQNLQAGKQSMLIDKGKGYAFNIDPIDLAQADIPYVQKWAAHAAKGMQIQIETDFFEDIYTQVHALNTGAGSGVKLGDIDLGEPGSPVVLTKSNVIDFLLDCRRILAEQNVPNDEKRKMVIPIWMAQLIKSSEIKDASLTGDGRSALRTGRIGEIDGWELFESNCLHDVTDGTDTVSNVFFNVKMSTQFATQLEIDEDVDNPDTYGKRKRGLQIYGWKVTKPEAAGHAYVVKG